MASVALMPTPTGPRMWTYGELSLERFREVAGCRSAVTSEGSKNANSSSSSIVKPNPPDARISELPRALGSGITQTYQECDSSYQYSNHYAPRRIFTKLIEPCKNDGYDNAEGDFICRVNDVIANPEGYGYEIADRLGHGTFGQVLRCVTCDNRSVAVKIIKNKPAYFQQALVEVRILQLLNRYYDTRIVKMTDYFVYRKHLCIVFEQLSMNLYDVLKQNSFRGLPVNMIKSIMDQLLRALVCLQTQGIIHCDLKPENILLVTKRNTKIKLIDFGSAAFSGYQVYTYIQSRFYRSPDVILGIHPFTTAIDMWSLGCILAELFLGLPLFPGSSEKDQLTRILALMGSVPCGILDKGRNTGKFYFPVEVEETFERPPGDDAAPIPTVLSRRLRVLGDSGGPGGGGSMSKAVVDAAADVGVFSIRFGQESLADSGEENQILMRTGLGFKLKNRREYEETTGKRENPSRKYSRHSTLRDMIMQAPMKAGLPPEQLSEETLRRERILHLVNLCLDFDPTTRITPAQALTHPLFVDDGRPGAGLPSDWLPRSAELCLMNLIDDTSSFLHNSSSRPIADGNDSAPSTPYRQGRGGYSPSCGGGGRQRSESIYSNASSPSQTAGPSGLRSFPQHQQQPVHVGSAPAASFMTQGGPGGSNRQGPVDEGNSNRNNSNKGIPLPDDTMPVSYRPALHKVPDSYFQGFIHGKYLMSSGHPLPLGVSPPAHYSRLQHQMQQQQQQQQQHLSGTTHRPFSGPHNTLAPQRTAAGHPIPHRSPGGTDGGGGSRTHDMMYAAKGSSSYHNHHHQQQQQQQQLAAGLYGSKATGQSRHGSDAPRGGLQSAQSRGQQQVYQSPSPGVSVHSSGSHGTYLPVLAKYLRTCPAPAFFVPNAPQVPHSLAAQTNVTNPMSALARDGPGSLEPSKPSGPLAAMPTSFCTCDRAAGEKCTFCWAWEPSEAGSSMPSVWSQATSRLTSGALSSGVYSKISLSSGVTISGNWLQGQRIHYVKPDCIPSKGGATVVVGVKKEIPQDMWNALEIVFRRHDRRPTTRNSPQLGTARPPDSPQAIPAGFVKTFKPEGIRKGKKLAVKIRGDFPPGDYDVSVCFAGRMLHGTLPIEVVERKELNDRDNESGAKPRADASSSSSHHSTPGMPPALASLLGTTNSIPEGGQLENPLMRALGGSGLPPAATDESK